MRAQGLRRIHFGVPDVRGKEFAQEAKRQSEIVRGHPQSEARQSCIKTASARWD